MLTNHPYPQPEPCRRCELPATIAKLQAEIAALKKVQITRLMSAPTFLAYLDDDDSPPLSPLPPDPLL